MTVVVNAVAARMGGAATYLRHFVECSARIDGRLVLLVTRGTSLPTASSNPNLELMEFGAELENPARRWFFDQFRLPKICREAKCDALLSTANFGSLTSPVPQVLLVRNPIYFSRRFLARLVRLGSWRERTENTVRRFLVLRSMRAADIVVFPTRAMQDEVEDWAGPGGPRHAVVPHGFDSEEFRIRAERARPAFAARMEPGAVNLCFVSHYAAHKDFATLCRGFSLARRTEPRLHLWLTAGIEALRSQVWGEDREAFEVLRREDGVTDLGTVSHDEVPGLYAASAGLVFPSIAESFAHPLNEAMSLGLPIIASSIPVHREICGDRASYFDPESPSALADRLLGLARTGARPPRDPPTAFTWSQHVTEIWRLLRESTRGRGRDPLNQARAGEPAVVPAESATLAAGTRRPRPRS